MITNNLFFSPATILFGLVGTLILERIVSIFFLRKNPRVSSAIIFVNLVSYPLLVYGASFFIDFFYLAYLSGIPLYTFIVAEVAVVFLEFGLLWYALPEYYWHRLLALSIIMNAVSAYIGFLLGTH